MEQIKEKEIREFIDKMIFTSGEEKTKEYIAMADWDLKTKDFAMGLINRKEPPKESMIELGDISELEV